MSSTAAMPARVSPLPVASSALPSASELRPKWVSEATRTPRRNRVCSSWTSVPMAGQPSSASTIPIRSLARACSTSPGCRQSMSSGQEPTVASAVSISRRVCRRASSGRNSSSTYTGSTWVRTW